MTRVLYLSSVDLPHRKARAIQIVNTAHALARAGAGVTLVGGRREVIGDAAILAPYGLAPHPGLRIMRVPIVRPPAQLSQWYTRFWQASYLTGLVALSPRLLRQDKPDVIIVRDLRLAWALCRLGPRVARRVAYEVHDLSSLESELRGAADEAARLSRVEREVFREVGRVVCITSELRRLVSERHGRPPERMAVIPDGTAAPEAALESTQRRRPDVYYVGQLYPWKGVDTLIEAASLDAAVRYVIVGGTEEPGVEDRDVARLESLARRLGVADRVTFTGWVPYSEVPKQLRDAAVTVIPLPDTPFGRYFTSPLKLFDYMSAGAPIVASDLPSLRDVIQHEHNALLVPPGDAGALARAVRRLLNDPMLAQRLADQARQDVAQYTWETRANRLLHFLRGSSAPT